MMELVPQLGVKNGTLLWPVRIAAAGQTVTPGGAFEILCILGRDESLRRLNLGLEKIRCVRSLHDERRDHHNGSGRKFRQLYPYFH